MQHPTKSTRRSKLLATGAMALTLAIGGGLAAGHSAFAADSSTGTSTSTQSQTQAQDPTSAGKAFRGGHFGQRGGGFFGLGAYQDKLASYLNLDAETLKTKLQTQTLAEIAADQNVDRETLKAQLVAWIEAAKPADAPAASDSSDSSASGKPAFDASAIADKLLDSPYGWAGKGDHKGFGGLRVIESADVASALGVTADELKEALQSGQSIAEVAADKGVDVQKAIDAVTTALKSQLDQQLSDGKITQDEYDSRSADLAEKAAAIVNGKRGQGGRGFPGQAPQPSNQAQADNNTTDGSSE